MNKRLSIIFIMSLLLIASASFSQDNSVINLLQNGDFEGGFLDVDGVEPRNVAEFWTPWHIEASDRSPSFANHNPNYDVETERIRLDEDGKAQKYFTLFATHQGGIYQEVDSLTSGATYRFSIYGYVWSSSFEDIDVSEDPGHVVLRVGIDPKGGIDGASEDIIWSTAATFFYDAYRQYAVIATAESESITVFVESIVGEPRANNYIYLDDAVLEVASESVILADHTPTAETNEEMAGDDELVVVDARGEQDATTAGAQAADDSSYTVVHIVEAEDTVSGLALQYGSTAEAISQANDLDAANLIIVGQRLIIPVNAPAQAAAAAVAASALTDTPSPTPTPTATPTSTPMPTSTPTSTPTPTPTATPLTYQIQPGDALVNIARQYGTTAELLAEINNIANPHRIDVGRILLIPTAIPPTPLPAADLRPTVTLYPTVEPTPDPSGATALPPWYIVYEVRIGDTLDEIARAHDTTVQELLALNDIADPRRIVPGQQIRLPSPYPTPTPPPTFTPLPTNFPVTYPVQEGDSLFIIAARYGVSVVELAQVNGIVDYEDLTVGQVLIIPA